MSTMKDVTIKTRTVTFSNGTVKNASLLVPAEACSINDLRNLIVKSYLDYAFSAKNILMSDECLTSSIGQANFFEGALGGYETRMPAESFRMLKEWCENEMSMAVDVAQYRMPGCSLKQAYLRASENEVLSEGDRKALVMMAEMTCSIS